MVVGVLDNQAFVGHCLSGEVGKLLLRVLYG